MTSRGPNLISRKPARAPRKSPPTRPRPDPVEVHPRLAALFRAFAEDGLAWCLLRGETELDGRPGDIDILVVPGDLRRLLRAARAAGFVRLPAQGYGSHRFLIAYDRDSDRWLKLDVVSELAFGPAFAWRIGDVAAVLERTRRGQAAGAWVLADADAFWALLLHGLLDKGRLDEAKRLRLGQLVQAARDGSPFRRVLPPLLPEGWAVDGVIDAVADGEWDRLDGLGRDLAVGLRQRHRLATARSRFDHAVGRRAARVMRVARPRGMTVALVGDPTLTGGAADELSAAVPIPSRTLVVPARPRSPTRGLRLRAQRGTSLVVYRANSVRDVPTRGGTPVDLLFCPPPDLVIVLDPSRASAPAGDTPGIRPTPGVRSDVPTVDATLSEGEIRRSIAGLVWDRLADRWNALDRRSAES